MKTKPLLLFAVIALAACPACGSGRSGNDRNDKIAFPPVAAARQNDSASVNTYLIADNCAGPFRIGALIPDKADGFVMTESKEDRSDSEGGIRETSVYIYEIGNEGWVKITPQYDFPAGRATGRIGEIFVYSDLFLTDKGVGAMSSIEEFAAAYPDFRIRYEREAALFVVETPRLKNVQFVIDDEYYQGGDAVFTANESCELQTSDFRKESYFTAIRIIGN